ncbi:MAG: hypothetical protein M0P69_18415 [Bacteroidales bacterium]|nr:hypothetical protein [Bacteroidales bacterium]
MKKQEVQKILHEAVDRIVDGIKEEDVFIGIAQLAFYQVETDDEADTVESNKYVVTIAEEADGTAIIDEAIVYHTDYEDNEVTGTSERNI